MTRASLHSFGIAAVLAVLVVYLVVSLQTGNRATTARPDASQHPLPPPFVMFRALAPHNGFGHLTVMALRPDAQRVVSPLVCTRLHYADGRGLCAIEESSPRGVRHAVYVFDRTLRPDARIELDGIPTRLRVAPGGSVGAITTYSEEESPAGERLSTRTRIVDMRTAQSLGELRQFRVDTGDLPPIHGPIDIASVAFEREGDRFFATVSTDEERYLVAGSISERRLTALRTGVASEALSPDGRRLIVKRLVPERGFWQLAVIDLATWAEHDLNQGTRSVDDQVEWFDNAHVAYHDVDGESTAVWVLAADGVGSPRVLMKDAYSAAVQR